MLFRVLSIFLTFTAAVLGLLLVRNQKAQASQSSDATTQHPSHPTPLILQEREGERRLRRPGGPSGSTSVPEFFIKVDKSDGGAEDF